MHHAALAGRSYRRSHSQAFPPRKQSEEGVIVLAPMEVPDFFVLLAGVGSCDRVPPAFR